jgi:hypothetical protein
VSTYQKEFTIIQLVFCQNYSGAMQWRREAGAPKDEMCQNLRVKKVPRSKLWRRHWGYAWTPDVRYPSDTHLTNRSVVCYSKTMRHWLVAGAWGASSKSPFTGIDVFTERLFSNKKFHLIGERFSYWNIYTAA